MHSRFSTNTFPTWGLAQPFRLLAHNGEINTIRGNRGWMEARESVLSSPALGDIKELSHHPAEHERQRLAGQRTGVPCHVRPQPTACHGNARTGILQRKEPHQRRPQGLLRIPLYPHGTLGRTCRTTLQRRTLCGWYVDRNGLRPARYLITHNDIMVVASEVGVMDFEPGDIKEKGRLQPGKIL